MVFASLGFSSRKFSSISETDCETADVTSLLPSLVFVCPSNCGSATFTEIIAVSPSLKSSPDISNFNLSNKPEESAYFFKVDVKPLLKPDR